MNGLGDFFSMFKTGAEKHSCFSEEEVQRCMLADKGELRGKTLQHLTEPQHLGSLAEQMAKILAGMEAKQQLKADFLAAKDQLPPFYLMSKGEKSDGVKIVNTADYLAEVKSKMEACAERIACLKELAAIFAKVHEGAMQVSRGLIVLNENPRLPQIAEFKEGPKAKYEEMREALCKTLAGKKIEIQKSHVNNIDDDNFLEILRLLGTMKGSSLFAHGRSVMKAVICTQVGVEELNKYGKIFDCCLKGIESKARVQDQSASSTSQ